MMAKHAMAFVHEDNFAISNICIQDSDACVFVKPSSQENAAPCEDLSCSYSAKVKWLLSFVDKGTQSAFANLILMQKSARKKPQAKWDVGSSGGCGMRSIFRT